MKRILSILGIAVSIAIAQSDVAGSCVNKFLCRTEGARQVVTLLTGRLTFQEAQALAEAIGTKKAAPIVWVDGNGKEIARQFGELKVIRPMPVGCDGKPSGTIMSVTFATASQPSKKISIKLDASTTISFDESE